MEEINRQVGQEVRMAFQTSVQIARFFADIQRRVLEHARRESWEQERLIRQTINDQRRLADPVLRQGLDERFWDKAQPKDAAYVWGVAERFKRVDPLAAQAADRCRREAFERWNIDLDAPSGPVTPGEVDDATLAEVAPVVEGEENRDLRADLAASAQAASREAEKVAGQVSTDPEQLLAAEEQTAWEWAQRHYDVKSLYPGIDEAERRQEAHVLYSCLAAEGYDLDHPPALDQLDGELDEAYAIETSVGAGSDFTAQTGIGAYDFERRVGSHDHAVAQRAWDAERQGRYPDLRAWRESIVLRGSEAVREVNRVQLTDAPHRRGTYTELARRSAAGEAERAGMRPEEYLDYLGAHQRRAVVSTRGQMDEQRAAGMGRMAAYRIAYAREAAARWPGRERGQDQGRKSAQDQASRSRQATSAETDRGQQVDQGQSAAASGNGADLEARARASCSSSTGRRPTPMTPGLPRSMPSVVLRKPRPMRSVLARPVTGRPPAWRTPSVRWSRRWPWPERPPSRPQLCGTRLRRAPCGPMLISLTGMIPRSSGRLWPATGRCTSPLTGPPRRRRRLRPRDAGPRASRRTHARRSSTCDGRPSLLLAAPVDVVTLVG